MRSRFSFGFLIFAAAGAMVLAGCSAPSSTSPSTTSSVAASSSANSSGPLGDLHTLDACSLVNVNDLSQYGKATTQLGSGYEYCELKTEADSSTTTVDISFDSRVGQRQRDENKDRIKHQGNLDYTTAASSDPSECHASVLTSDDVWIHYNASAVGSGAPLCPQVDAAVQSTIKIIPTGQVKHRTYPPGAWGNLAYCSLLDQAAVGQVSGVDSSAKIDLPGGHNCVWGRTLDQLNENTSTPSVIVDLMLRIPLNNLDQPKVQDVAGRKAIVEPHAADSSNPLPRCKVQTFGRKIQDAVNNPGGFSIPELDETTEIWVYANLPADQLCSAAKSLAAVAWPKLTA